MIVIKQGQLKIKKKADIVNAKSLTFSANHGRPRLHCLRCLHAMCVSQALHVCTVGSSGPFLFFFDSACDFWTSVHASVPSFI